jgi:hypothetical protein
MVVLSAFATDNVTPAAAQAETALVMSNVSPAEIINVVTAPKTPLLKRADLRHERDDGGA